MCGWAQGWVSQEFKLKADRRSVIIRAVGFTVKIVVRGFVTFIFMRRNKNKAVTLRSIVFKYPGFTARCWLSVGWGISGTSIRFMGFNSLYGYDCRLCSGQVWSQMLFKQHVRVPGRRYGRYGNCHTNIRGFML